MLRLTRERLAEIREWSIQPKHYLRPPTGQEVGAVLDEVDALRVDSTFLNEAVIEACADRDYFARLFERLEAAMHWRPIESAPYATPVLAWLFLPKNPIASGPVIANRCYVQKDDPESYPEHLRLTIGCWFANGMYYSAGHVTHWMPLPEPPSK